MPISYRSLIGLITVASVGGFFPLVAADPPVLPAGATLKEWEDAV
jgi:hypothetical protein